MLFKRAIAILIDTVLLNLVITGLATLGGVQEVGFIVSFIVGAVYQGYFLSQYKGQTLGKMLMGIRVVKSGGGRISFVTGVLRYIGYYLNSFVLMIGWLLAIFTGRGFHDMIAGTKVVDA